MQLTSEDREIIILLKYANLKTEQANVLAMALNAYFIQAFTLTEAAQQLSADLSLNETEAKKIILAGGVLYYSQLDPNMQDEIYVQLEQNNIDYIALKQSLFEIESKIIFDEEVEDVEEDDRSAILNIFQNNLITFLNSTLPDNRKLFNEGLIEYLLTEGVAFQADLEKAVKANQEKIGDGSITVNGQLVEPTIANWIMDFEANNLIIASNTARAQYFNNSKNYQQQQEQDKNLLIQLLDAYSKIKNFAQYFVKEDPENWHIIPPLANEDELRKKEKIDEVKNHYDEDIKWLKEKYHLEANLAKYQNLTVQELLATLDKEPRNPEVVLPVLQVLSEKDQTLQSLAASNLAARIKNNEFYPGLKGFKDRLLLRQILDICELSADESALFVMYLAAANKNLMGLSYADLKENAFKWR